MAPSSSVPPIEGLFDLACRSGVDIRPTLLRVLTDIFVQKRSHSAEEKAQYAELASRLLDHVDDATRQSIASRLSQHPDTPPRIAARLGIAVPPAHKTFEPERNELLESFFAADAYERRLILTNLEQADPSQPPRAALHAPETCRRLEAAALSGKIGEFAAMLEGTLLLPAGVATRITEDPSGEPILIAVKALGMPSEMLQRILLFINPAIGHSVPRIYELAALYHEISVETAESMLAIWRGRAPAPTARNYQPALHPDEPRPARVASSTSRYRLTRRSDAQAARFKSSGR